MTDSDKMFFAARDNPMPHIPEFTILDSWRKWKHVIIEELSGDTYMYKQQGLSTLYHKWNGSNYDLIAKFTIKV